MIVCLWFSFSVNTQLEELQSKVAQKQEEVNMYREKYEHMTKRVRKNCVSVLNNDHINNIHMLVLPVSTLVGDWQYSVDFRSTLR